MMQAIVAFFREALVAHPHHPHPIVLEAEHSAELVAEQSEKLGRRSTEFGNMVRGMRGESPARRGQKKPK